MILRDCGLDDWECREGKVEGFTRPAGFGLCDGRGEVLLFSELASDGLACGGRGVGCW